MAFCSPLVADQIYRILEVDECRMHTVECTYSLCSARCTAVMIAKPVAAL